MRRLTRPFYHSRTKNLISLSKSQTFTRLDGTTIRGEFLKDRWDNVYVRANGRLITPFEFRVRFKPLTLNQVFHVCYSEKVESLVSSKNPFFELIEKDTNFVGKPVLIPF